jgi:DNA polymerase-1
MVKIFALIKNHGAEIKILLQVHDELIFEIKKDKLDYYLPRIESIMTSVLKLKVPLTVDGSVGDNWGELK